MSEMRMTPSLFEQVEDDDSSRSAVSEKVGVVKEATTSTQVRVY